MSKMPESTPDRYYQHQGPCLTLAEVLAATIRYRTGRARCDCCSEMTPNHNIRILRPTDEPPQYLCWHCYEMALRAEVIERHQQQRGISGFDLD